MEYLCDKTTIQFFLKDKSKTKAWVFENITEVQQL